MDDKLNEKWNGKEIFFGDKILRRTGKLEWEEFCALSIVCGKSLDSFNDYKIYAW